MTAPIIICCQGCNGEGRIYECRIVYGHDAPPYQDDVDVGPCPYCDGTGGEIIEGQPIELEDLETIGGVAA